MYNCMVYFENILEVFLYMYEMKKKYDSEIVI